MSITGDDTVGVVSAGADGPMGRFSSISSVGKR